MKKEVQRTWIFFAVSKQRIFSGGDPRHWRAFLGENPEEVPLMSCVLHGVASELNFRTQTNPARNAERDLVAWCAAFGDVVIGEDDVAHVTLLPDAPEPPRL